MKALTPWTGMTALKREMDRLFERVWEGDLPDWPSFGEWSPKLDVADTRDALDLEREAADQEEGRAGHRQQGPG